MADNDNNAVIKFTPSQFVGMIVMFIGLIATAIGPYIAVKEDIHHLNVRFAELDLKLTTYFHQRENEHKKINNRLDALEMRYGDLHDYQTSDKAIKSKN